LVKVAARDTYTYLQYSHCNLDKEELLEGKVEAIHIPDTTDNPHWAYKPVFEGDNLQRVHNLERAVDSCALVASNPVAEIQGKEDMVDTQVEREALPRDEGPGSQTHARDR
jgi:hypothetical protein